MPYKALNSHRLVSCKGNCVGVTERDVFSEGERSLICNFKMY